MAFSVSLTFEENRWLRQLSARANFYLAESLTIIQANLTAPAKCDDNRTGCRRLENSLSPAVRGRGK
jgi:hypothetical protein